MTGANARWMTPLAFLFYSRLYCAGRGPDARGQVPRRRENLVQHLAPSGLSRLWCAVVAALSLVLALGGPVFAATTGTISGTVTVSDTKKPLPGVTVVAASPSGTGRATTDANGFFNINGLAPDTYAVSLTATGYESVVLSGVTVVQDQTVTINQSVARSLQKIGGVSARSASNLVQPNQTADVYNVSAQQLAAAAGEGGHRTLYDVIQTSAGVTSTGVSGRPRIRGSDVGDVAWEYDGIPINDRLTGLFTTNLSIIGTQNLEVYTGGYNAQYGNAAAGLINSVVKRGTYPGFGSVTYTSQFPYSEHDLVAEYGGATPNGRLSWYFSLDSSNSDDVFANGYQPFMLAQALTARDTTPSTINSRDAVANIHFRPTSRDDIQFLVQTGNQKLPWDKGLSGQAILGIEPCNGVVISGGAITNPGTSSSGLPCTVPVVTTPAGGVPTITGYKNTGLQYYALGQQDANVWYHWSNLGKIQWNHVFSDKLFASFRLAENFNQYIFDQPFSLATINGNTTPGTPYLAGPPIGTTNPGRVTGFAPNGTPAAAGNGYQDEFDDRRSQMYFANLDFTYTANARSTYYFGLGYERDNSAERYFDHCGCDETSGGVGAFNLDGTWPNLFLQVDYPLILPSAYIGTKQILGKLTLEPSIRYDAETYDIPNRPNTINTTTGAVIPSYAYGPYSTHAFSPRFAASWAFDPYDTLRGSYGVTTTFIPAAYVFNDSPNGVGAGDSRVISPYYPGADLTNPLNFNVDLSFAHALKNGVDSIRVSPFYRHAVNKLEAVKPYSINPVTGVLSESGTTYFRTGVQDKATGVELAWDHVVRGDGFSWYLDGTYVNYWGSVTAAALSGGTPYGSLTSSSSYLAAFLATGELFRNPSQPPWSITWTGDYRKGPYHVDPYLIYQVGAPYNVVPTSFTNPVTGTTTRDTTGVHFARANYWAAIDLGYDIIRTPKHKVTLGLDIRNLFNQRVADVVPSTNANYGKAGLQNPDLNTYGPGSVNNTLYYYAPDQQPTQYQLYLQTKF